MSQMITLYLSKAEISVLHRALYEYGINHIGFKASTMALAIHDKLNADLDTDR